MTAETCLVQEARDLLPSIHGSEVRRRTVIYNAYYAAYHRIHEYARHLGFRFDRKAGGGCHAQLKTFIVSHRSTDPYLDEVVEDFKTLMNRRIKASYYLNAEVTASDALDSVNLAEEILDCIPAITSSADEQSAQKS